MKKLIALLLCALMLSSLSACGGNSDSPTSGGTLPTGESSQLTGEDAKLAEDLVLAMKLWSTGLWVNESNADVAFVFREDGSGTMANPIEKDIKWTVDSAAKTITITEVFLGNEMASTTYGLEAGDGYFTLTDSEKSTTAKYVPAEK